MKIKQNEGELDRAHRILVSIRPLLHLLQKRKKEISNGILCGLKMNFKHFKLSVLHKILINRLAIGSWFIACAFLFFWLFPNSLQTKATSPITVISSYTEQNTFYDGGGNQTSLSIELEDIPSDTGIVFFTSYRRGDPSYTDDSVLDVVGGSYEYFTFGCQSYEAEYVTEVWYYAANNLSSYETVYVTWAGEVFDVRAGVTLFDGIDLDTLYYADSNSVTSCANGWTGTPTLAVPSSVGELVVGAVGTYSDFDNALSPVSAVQELWNQTGGVNIVMSAATWNGGASTQASWNMTNNLAGDPPGWPWSIATVRLPNADPVVEEDSTPPTITLTSPDSALQTSDITVSGTVDDAASNVSSISYAVYLASSSEPALTTINYDGTSNSEAFSFAVNDLAVGEYRLRIYAEDSESNSGLATEYDFEVVAAPSCILENLTSPTNDTTPTYTGTCTDPNQITALYYRFYDVLEGDYFAPSPNYPAISSFTSGGLGSTSLAFTFTPSSSLPDGSYIVEVIAENSIGESTPEGNRAQDYLTVEAVDNRPPTLIFNDIAPNPTTDTRPYITGACRDTYEFETNSTIASIEYRLDSSNPLDWVEIDAFDSQYDSATESFSFRLPELSVASHTVEVRCTDSAGNSTEDDATSKSQTFTVTTPSATNPEIVTFSEDFTTQLRNSIFFTDAIWGNGRVRLKEDIDFTTTTIDSNNYGARYGEIGSLSDYDVVEGTDNLIWFVKESEFASYNTSTEQLTTYSASTYGMSRLSTIAQTKNSDGDILLFVAGRSGLLLFNVTDNVHTVYTDNGFNSSEYQPNRIALDTRDGRIGAYIRTNNSNGGLETNLLHLDTGTNFTNQGDDTVTWLTTSGGITMTQVGHIELDQTRDLLHVSVIGSGLGTIHDNNTPSNTADDTRSTYSVSGKTQNVTDIALDTTSHTLFFTNSTTLYRMLYAVVFDDESSISLADATKYEMAGTSDLYSYSLSKVEFLEGPEYVGNQLFMTSDEGVILYYNTNGSYSDSQDDTVIVFKTAGDRYPAATKNVVVADYNTLYTAIDRIGFMRVDLDRAWESSNTAVGISAPETDQLYVNHITLEDLEIVARIDDQGNVSPTSQAAVDSFISVDDGLTWESIDVGQKVTVDSEDYRVRFRLDLATNPGTTAIVDTYSLSFGAYAQAPTDPTLTLSPSVSTVQTNQNFSMTITAADELGFPVLSYDQPVTLALYDASTNAVTTGLNTTQGTLNDGTVSLSGLQINKSGSFYIRADDGTRQANSTVITVTQTPVASTDPVPTLSFSASKYETVANEKITLNWSSSNLTELTLDNGHGKQSLNGSLEISPDNSRTYTLTGTGPYGGLQSSLNIKVNPAPVSSKTATASATRVSQNGFGGFAAEFSDESSDETAKEVVQEVRITSPTLRKQIVAPQAPVRIQWNVIGDPDRVFIDYLNKDVSSKGSFDLIATESTTITITAYKNGEVAGVETFAITVDENISESSQNLYERIRVFATKHPIQIMLSLTAGMVIYLVWRLLAYRKS